jgi:hypothetical protein
VNLRETEFSAVKISFAVVRRWILTKHQIIFIDELLTPFPRMNIDQKNDSSSRERIRMENLGRTFFALFFMAIIVVGYLVFGP